MINTVLAALRCPVCQASLHDAVSGPDAGPGPTPRHDPGPAPHHDPGASGLRCANGHAFDQARHGYVHLGPGRKLPAGDTAEMVAARVRFLAAGHYAPLRAAIADATPAGARLIVDVG